MSAAREAQRTLGRVIDQLLNLEKVSEDDAFWRQVLTDISTANEKLASIAEKCLHCGGPNARSGEFCSDRCRSAHYREHMPSGVVKSVRRLAADKASVVIHYPPAEAERVVAIKINEPVWLAQEQAS